jgi:hypothetical protein
MIFCNKESPPQLHLKPTLGAILSDVRFSLIPVDGQTAFEIAHRIGSNLTSDTSSSQSD